MSSICYRYHSVLLMIIMCCRYYSVQLIFITCWRYRTVKDHYILPIPFRIVNVRYMLPILFRTVNVHYVLPIPFRTFIVLIFDNKFVHTQDSLFPAFVDCVEYFTNITAADQWAKNHWGALEVLFWNPYHSLLKSMLVLMYVGIVSARYRCKKYRQIHNTNENLTYLSRLIYISELGITWSSDIFITVCLWAHKRCWLSSRHKHFPSLYDTGVISVLAFSTRVIELICR